MAKSKPKHVRDYPEVARIDGELEQLRGKLELAAELELRAIRDNPQEYQVKQIRRAAAEDGGTATLAPPRAAFSMQQALANVDYFTQLIKDKTTERQNAKQQAIDEIHSEMRPDILAAMADILDALATVVVAFRRINELRDQAVSRGAGEIIQQYSAVLSNTDVRGYFDLPQLPGADTAFRRYFLCLVQQRPKVAQKAAEILKTLWSEKIVIARHYINRIKGYVAVYGKPSHDGIIIHPGAFRHTLEASGRIEAYVSHQPRLEIASTADRTLRLTHDRFGVYAEIDLVDTPLNQSVVAAMSNGMLGHMSWRGPEHHDSAGNITAVDELIEVSIIGTPHFSATFASLAAPTYAYDARMGLQLLATVDEYQRQSQREPQNRRLSQLSA